MTPFAANQSVSFLVNVAHSHFACGKGHSNLCVTGAFVTDLEFLADVATGNVCKCPHQIHDDVRTSWIFPQPLTLINFGKNVAMIHLFDDNYIAQETRKYIFFIYIFIYIYYTHTFFCLFVYDHSRRLVENLRAGVHFDRRHLFGAPAHGL